MEDGFKERDFSFKIRAGIGSENSPDEAYCFSTSFLPAWISSVDDPRYNALMRPLYEAATKIAEETGIPFTLEGSIKKRIV